MEEAPDPNGPRGAREEGGKRRRGLTPSESGLRIRSAPPTPPPGFLPSRPPCGSIVPVSSQQQDVQKALSVLQEAYGGMVERLTEAVLQDEDQIRDSQFSFAYQEVEDRFGPRIVNLSHLINALQNAAGRPTVEEFRVETVIAAPDLLAEEVNKRLRTLRGSSVKNIALQKMDDGQFFVLITVGRAVYARSGGK